MARGSFTARLREVLLRGPGLANTYSFGGGVLEIERPPASDGVVIYPDPNIDYINDIRLVGDIGDVGLVISERIPTIVSTQVNVILLCAGSGATIAAAWFRY